MTLKIPQSLSIEFAEDVGNNNLRLKGTDDIHKIIDSVPIEGNSLFSNHYDINDELLYHASIIQQQREQLQEIGLGVLKKDKEGFYIKRVRQFYAVDASGGVGHTLEPIDLLCKNSSDQHLLVSSHKSQDLRELLYESHTIITCESPHLPTPVKLQEYSLLGRFRDGIKSIGIGELVSPKIVSDIIKNFKNKLTLKSSGLEVKKTITNNLYLKPTKNAEEKEGSVYYDSQSKTLKYFNGTLWKEL